MKLCRDCKYFKSYKSFPDESTNSPRCEAPQNKIINLVDGTFTLRYSPVELRNPSFTAALPLSEGSMCGSNGNWYEDKFRLPGFSCAPDK